MSNGYIQLLNDEINFYVNTQKIKDDTLNESKFLFEDEEKRLNLDESPKKKEMPKLDEMKKLKMEMQSEVKCFSSFNNDKNLIIGLDTGEIEVYEFCDEKTFKLKLKINEFHREIKFICELDCNILAVTDGTRIKIIELKDNMKEYKLIQTLYLQEDSEIIYTMINLPILSYTRSRHYFCTGDEKHILIWKSNKQPKNIKLPDNDEAQSLLLSEESVVDEDNEPLYFTLEKDIQLKYMTR